jgi:hypothetical protein
MRRAIKEDKQKKLFLLAAVLVFQVVIYAPHVGTGFITDDFVWLDNTVVNGEVDYLRPFTATTGFYRPMVSLTFALQYRLHGMNPRPYGWLNLLLHLVNILLVYLVLSSVEISRPYALWVTALFAINAKGPAMAVGWISGRTTLLFTFFMLLALYIYLNIRQQPAGKKWDSKRILQYSGVGILYFAALLSKETAAALPVFVFLASFLVQKKENRQGLEVLFKKIQTAFFQTAVFLVPLLLYFVLRLNSNAMTPFDAPDFYRYTLAPLIILKNLSEYIIRAGILDMAVILWLLVVLLFTRRKTKPAGGINRPVLIAGGGWFLCFLLPTLLIPVRSDIYVYIPQVGFHLLALPVIFFLWERTGLNNKKRIKQAIALLPIGILVLAYLGQLAVTAAVNGKNGYSSYLFTQQVRQCIADMKNGDHVFVIDGQAEGKRSPGRTVSYGFEPLLKLYAPRKGLMGKIIPPADAAQVNCDEQSLHFFPWGNGRLRGPFNRTGLKTFFYLLHPHSLALLEIKQEPVERHFLLKKRKKWLREQKRTKKQNEAKKGQKEKINDPG